MNRYVLGFVFVLFLFVGLSICSASTASDVVAILAEPKGCSNGQCTPVKEPAIDPEAYKLPYRRIQADKESEIAIAIEQSTDAQRQVADAIKALAASQNKPVAAVPAAPTTIIERIEAKKEEAKEKADALLESPVAKHFAIFIALIAIVLVGHAVYVKCHADRANIQEKLTKISPQLAERFAKLDDFNTKLENKIHGVDSTLQTVQSSVTNANVKADSAANTANSAAKAIASVSTDTVK